MDFILEKTYPKLSKRLTTRDLHEILIELLVEFDRVCRKNNIPYALAYGSALGIYNYSGFIPWDDDVDIAVDYFDFPKLIDALNRDLDKDKFYFQCYETDNKYNVLINQMKIRKKGTFIKEKNNINLPNKCKSGDGIFIDIVTFMGVPKNNKEHLRLLQKSKKIMPFYVFFDSYLHLNLKNTKRKLKEYERKIASKYCDSNYVGQSIIIPFQNWGENKVISFPKNIIYPFKQYDFEGHKFYSFNNLEEYLILNYGKESLKKKINDKYIDPYPVKKRVPKHIKKIKI